MTPEKETPTNEDYARGYKQGKFDAEMDSLYREEPPTPKTVEEVVLKWLENEKIDNYVQGDLTTSYTLDGYFDVGALVEALLAQNQAADKRLREVVREIINNEGYTNELIDPDFIKSIAAKHGITNL